MREIFSLVDNIVRATYCFINPNIVDIKITMHIPSELSDPMSEQDMLAVI